MKPSRTYALGVLGVVAELLLAVVGLVVALVEPAALPDLVPFLSTVALSIAGATGVSAGGLSIRDAASGGLTSSQGEQVAAARRAQGPG